VKTYSVQKIYQKSKSPTTTISGRRLALQEDSPESRRRPMAQSLLSKGGDMAACHRKSIVIVVNITVNGENKLNSRF
jgi:hypothetical protein